MDANATVHVAEALCGVVVPALASVLVARYQYLATTTTRAKKPRKNGAPRKGKRRS